VLTKSLETISTLCGFSLEAVQDVDEVVARDFGVAVLGEGRKDFLHFLQFLLRILKIICGLVRRMAIIYMAFQLIPRDFAFIFSG
jgi:hypothetical protein